MYALLELLFNTLYILTQINHKSNYILRSFYLFGRILTNFRVRFIKINMNNGYIAVYDSGIGGISTLAELKKRLPVEKFLYFGDNGNAPYGNRTKDDLLKIAVNNINYICGFGVKAIVAACNTLSVTVLDKLRYYSDVPVFGVFPPVETAVLSGGRTLLLATPVTAAVYAEKRLKGVTAIGLNRLAGEIERRAFSLGEVNAAEQTSDALSLSGLSRLDKAGVFDTVILGCTHFSFVKKQIVDHFNPKTVLNGNFFTANSVERAVKKSKSSVNNCENKVLFVGRYARFNGSFYEKVVNESGFFS